MEEYSNSADRHWKLAGRRVYTGPDGLSVLTCEAALFAIRLLNASGKERRDASMQRNIRQSNFLCLDTQNGQNFFAKCEITSHCPANCEELSDLVTMEMDKYFPHSKPEDMDDYLWERVYDSIEDRPAQNPPLQLQHKISVWYPSPRLLQDGEEIDEPVGDVSHMHNPLDPLLEDVRVNQAAGHSDLDRYTFSTVYAASTQLNEPDFDAFIAEQEGQDTIKFLHAIQRYQGETHLDILPYKSKKDGRSVTRIRLACRCIFFNFEAQGFQFNFELQCLTFEAWERYLFTQANQTDHAWIEDIHELVMGSSRRAIAHRLMMRAQHYELKEEGSLERAEAEEETKDAIEANYNFKPRRWPNYEAILSKRQIDIDNIPADDRMCLVCRSDLGPETQAVSFCGDNRHNACQDCLLQLCRAMGPLEAKCVLCAKRLFSEGEEYDFLTVGWVQGAYQPDPAYAAWENAWRGCADLDSQALDIMEFTFKDERLNLHNCDLVVTVWLHFMDIELVYPDPARKSVMNTREWALITQVFISLIYNRRDEEPKYGILYMSLVRDLQNFLVRRACWKRGYEIYGRANCEYHLENAEPEQISANRREGMQTYAHGIDQVICRVLHRTLNFLRLRECSCQAAPPEGTPQDVLWDNRFHTHTPGGMLYYDPVFFERLFPQTTGFLQRDWRDEAYWKFFDRLPQEAPHEE